MRRKIIFPFVFALFHCLIFAQQEQRLSGKVVSDSTGIPSVTVMNLVNEQVTQTNAQGEFSLMAKEDDLLVFSHLNYEYRRRLIEAGDIKKGAITVKLIPKPTQLDEVVILRDINPEDLGLVPKGQKTYTPAQRRLKQAGELKPMAMIGMVAGLSIPVDPIINAITGRTKMLKKDVKTERKERFLEKISGMYQNEHYTDRLKIPAQYVEGFRYYIVEDAGFTAALESGSKTRVDLQMTLLAQKYNELIALETK